MSIKIPNEEYKNWANQIIKGQVCQSYMEDVIQDYWYGEKWFENDHCPVLFDIGCDDYDWSLELHIANLTDDAEVEKFCREKLNKEFRDFIKENGVGHFWVNFHLKEDKSSAKTHECYCCSDLPNNLKIFDYKKEYPCSHNVLKYIKIDEKEN